MMSVTQELIEIKETQLERLNDHLKKNTIQRTKLETERRNLLIDIHEVERKIKKLKEV